MKLLRIGRFKVRHIFVLFDEYMYFNFKDTKNITCPSGQDGFFQVCIGEIKTVRVPTADDMMNASYRYKSFSSGQETLSQMRFRQQSKSILGTSSPDQTIDLQVLLSLNDFLPFMSEPNFRECSKRTNNLYSTMAFWLFDNTYGAIFFHNISNYSKKGFSDAYKIKQEVLDGLLPTFHQKRNVSERDFNQFDYLESTCKLETIFERGDLSFAPDPVVPYQRFGVENSDLHLEVINQMLVS